MVKMIMSVVLLGAFALFGCAEPKKDFGRGHRKHDFRPEMRQRNHHVPPHFVRPEGRREFRPMNPWVRPDFRKFDVNRGPRGPHSRPDFKFDRKGR